VRMERQTRLVFWRTRACCVVKYTVADGFYSNDYCRRIVANLIGRSANYYGVGMEVCLPWASVKTRHAFTGKG